MQPAAEASTISAVESGPPEKAQGRVVPGGGKVERESSSSELLLTAPLAAREPLR